MRIALHTKVRADRIEEYEAAHREVPAELTTAIRAAGATSWTIWRSGTDLFHVIDCEDYAALLAELEKLPVNVAWQARMAELLDVAHDYSSDGAEAGLPVAWEL
ncbi:MULTISPECIES: L-rhamnose mutarotase [unclassified Streptomyces]|jgi:L-rhamnose mutarotase|uniref:L-rhamnose mutarotase n=1 Tax=unclassified Streptomyces TaxID=2593676 RepID=UPI00224DCB3D|nr:MULTISPECIES: L-rhamnose mutarotase [unclassified Streptomyces]WSP59299.1 L-rhamnose mutarotase [Streptomyces sp. NBC_01241]WSU20181.1 L-rhamnose mutarotase [Streptomyces sp. NBC_01108]WTA39615.1 L-rhamnose mutarotase [Streptomyces sp. NBC_00846]MCX4791053.1 L-rhamnose mutarotase [Streptomyces sp. NBC_01221]MCX4793222.1 L-rhamnose mutarotase [Streptomyces sp. NBC_01242]